MIIPVFSVSNIRHNYKGDLVMEKFDKLIYFLFPKYLDKHAKASKYIVN